MLPFTRTGTVRLFIRASEVTSNGRYNVVIIDPVRSFDVPDGQHSGTSTTNPTTHARWKVVRYPYLDSGPQPVESSPPSGGSRLTPRQIESVWNLAGNRTEVFITPRPGPDTGPHFISGDRNPVCFMRFVEVGLTITRVAELPDLGANLDYLREVFRAVPEPDSPTSLLSFVNHYLDYAERIAFRPGDDLPVALDGDSTAAGVLRLGEHLGGRDFRAVLYLAAPVDSVPRGTLLRRTVHWNSGGQPREISRVVATVVG